MNIRAYSPSELLAPFIKTYLIIEAEDELVSKVLPDTSLVMAFRFKGKVSHLSQNTNQYLPQSVISGLRKSGRLISYSKNSGNILVIFREAGASAFIREPLYELFEHSISLDNFSAYGDLSMIEDQLTAETSNAGRINLLEQFLLSKLCYKKPDNLVLTALERIHSVKGIIKIKALADSLYISLDPFEKRFRRIVGISPKQFSYIVRMKAIINKGIAKQSLSDIAFDAGYSDQSHFNKDFKLFTRQTPTDFFNSPAPW